MELAGKMAQGLSKHSPMLEISSYPKLEEKTDSGTLLTSTHVLWNSECVGVFSHMLVHTHSNDGDK